MLEARAVLLPVHPDLLALGDRSLRGDLPRVAPRFGEDQPAIDRPDVLPELEPFGQGLCGEEAHASARHFGLSDSAPAGDELEAGGSAPRRLARLLRAAAGLVGPAAAGAAPEVPLGGRAHARHRPGRRPRPAVLPRRQCQRESERPRPVIYGKYRRSIDRSMGIAYTESS